MGRSPCSWGWGLFARHPSLKDLPISCHQLPIYIYMCVCVSVCCAVPLSKSHQTIKEQQEHEMAAAAFVVGTSCATSSSAAARVGSRWRKVDAGFPYRVVVCSAASSPSSPYYVGSLVEHYRTLRIQPGASEKEVKKAFRQLALQYHPDVCKGGNSGVQFHRINEAYDSVMSSLRSEEEEVQAQGWCEEDEQMRGMHDPSWELWEEWMGWEGAGIRDYSSHINPYI
ncbi:hypothetical protein Taro_054290 [Colocasia esculenta]|uniref:J domain-containing protein n=1 Tax=Colocasia esculenta TaxID=4460 RepID=A0A843XNB0_COLES|nr:hypothetical protein [Colocasia esculenta]